MSSIDARNRAAAIRQHAARSESDEMIQRKFGQEKCSARNGLNQYARRNCKLWESSETAAESRTAPPTGSTYSGNRCKVESRLSKSRSSTDLEKKSIHLRPRTKHAAAIPAGASRKSRKSERKTRPPLILRLLSRLSGWIGNPCFSMAGSVIAKLVIACLANQKS